MKNFYKYFGIVAIMLFSFYYTEKIAIVMREKDPISRTIEDTKKDSEVKSLNASITDNKIIPGRNGLSINVHKSFQKMKSFGAFNKYYLIFDQVKPDISLENNKDKIIEQGNSSKKSISLIIENNDSVIKYLKENKIKASLLTTQETYQKNESFERINNETNYWKELEKSLDKDSKNTNICIVNPYNEKNCKKNKKYLVKATLELTSTNVATIKTKISSGNIVLIKQNAKLEDVKLLINQINYKGFEIIYVSELISESNSLE